jgi:hypothetical protein
MDYRKILKQLVEERRVVDQALAALEPLIRKQQRHRGPGRPPSLFSKSARRRPFASGTKAKRRLPPEIPS